MTTLFSIFALRGRDRDNPSLRGRSKGVGGDEMRTNLIGFRRNWAHRNWGGLWSIDGHELTNEEAHTFVDRAIEAGYTVDEDVPDDLVREWIGLTEKAR